MPKKTLVIDGNRDHFNLEVEAGTLRVGMDSDHPEGVAKYLRVSRIRCEIDIDDDRESVPIEETGVITPRSIRPGSPVQLTHANIALQLPHHPSHVIPTPASHDAPTSVTPNTSTTGKHKRLKVIDGADQGRSFRLADTGVMTVGKSGKHVEIALDDLYVSKQHCRLEINGDAITVSHLEGPGGTHIDGQKLLQPQVIRTGSILRVGNSHLRLESGNFADEPIAAKIAIGSDSSGDSTSKLRAIKAPVELDEELDPNDPMASMVGDVLGHYELGRMVGRGFSGAVFLAHHTETAQSVAVKVLTSNFPRTQAELERFARELKSIQKIQHDNLASPIGAGKSGSHCWIAREFVDGESAHRVIGRVAKGEKANWTNAVRVGVHLARALSCVHEHRVIHGNITPRNVLIDTQDQVTKLTDLRFAQCIQGSELEQAIREPKHLAELPYLAPEQAEPGGFIDELADLYAVGAVVYALSAGRPPAVAATPRELLDQIRTGKLARLKTVNKRVPNELDTAVMKCLALRQEDRFPNATALTQEFELIAREHGIET